jgi:DNA-binding YbaB/EbfC family protein
MPKMFDMMKQLKQVKKMQKQLAAKTVEVSSADGLVSVVASGDMKIKGLKVDPQLIDPAKPEKLTRLLVSTINSALDSSKKAAASDMSKLTGGIPGLSDMLGG